MRVPYDIKPFGRAGIFYRSPHSQSTDWGTIGAVMPELARYGRFLA